MVLLATERVQASRESMDKKTEDGGRSGSFYRTRFVAVEER